MKLETKLKQLPKTPGVYFYKDMSGEIIYIGKAANLKNRVGQYFQKSRARDAKTDALISEIATLDWTELETELDALFLEAEMVRRYLPRYNILLRDDKSLVYIRIDYKNDYPTVSTTRRPLDDGAKYYGPYFSALSVRQALKILRRIFPFATRRMPNQKRASLHYHLGLDPGLEDGKTSLEDYRANLRKLMAVIEGKRGKIAKELEVEMKRAAKAQDFETAAKIRNQFRYLNSLNRQVIFSDREHLDLSKDEALFELTKLLNLKKPPYRIEGFDISHMSGTDNTASMVVFCNGVPNKSEYRKFKMRLMGNDDFAHMREVMTRRFSETNIKKWGKPDLILIDGGKGQVGAARGVIKGLNIEIPLIGLAKRFEQIIVPRADDQIDTIDLPLTSHLVKLLQRIRDESHRFAVSYHSSLKNKRQTASLLDDIPGIGPATRKKLIRAFGSMRGISDADQQALAGIIGSDKAEKLKALTNIK